MIKEIYPEVEEEAFNENIGAARSRRRSQIDAHLMEAILEQIVGEDLETRRDAAIRALLAFTWTQRLYFIVRSALMGVLGAAITAGVVVLIGEVNALQVAAISVLSFVVTLAITRLLDFKLTNASKRIVAMLTRHRQLRGLILDHF